MSHRIATLLCVALASGCASNVVAVQDRRVQDELAVLAWRPAVADELAGRWRLRSLEGPVEAAILDLSYWIGADGRFSGAALFVGPPPAYEVLSGSWTLGDGSLQLGDEAVPARADVADGLLRLSGEEGRIVLERPPAR